MTTAAPLFTSKAGISVTGVTASKLREIRAALANEYGISPLQICEAGGYSMAVVVRFALGLSAAGGNVVGIIRDCFAGLLVAATVRHLINAGANGALVVLDEGRAQSTELQAIIRPLERMGTPIYDLTPSKSYSDVTDLVVSCHNALIGLCDAENPAIPAEFQPLISALNELPTPLHAVESPVGMDLDTGKSLGDPMFASSTLSIGLPLAGLHAGKDYVGRHYICDSSISKELYGTTGQDLSGLFADQPVVQITPA